MFYVLCFIFNIFHILFLRQAETPFLQNSALEAGFPQEPPKWLSRAQDVGLEGVFFLQKGGCCPATTIPPLVRYTIF